MKLVKIMLATTFALTAATTSFAATESTEDGQKVIVSTQETTNANEAEQPNQPLTQPAAENADAASTVQAQP